VNSIPPEIRPYLRTEEFTKESVPPGLDVPHNNKPGVWARICILDGTLVYRILEPSTEEHTLRPGADGVVEPQVDHQLLIEEPVRFFVEFLRLPS
jgi:tellurite resistance-related uncharacterized protein